jgi:hypothetical protein
MSKQKADAIQKDGLEEEVDVKEEILEDEIEKFEEEASEEEAKPKSKREQDMQAILDQRKESLEENLGDSLDGDDEEEEDASNTVFTVKIDGEEKEVTADDLVKSYQIDASARKKMQEASELKKSLEKEREEIESARKELEDKKLEKRVEDATDKEAIQDEDKKEDTQIDLAEITREIREGDDEEALKALEALVSHVGKSKPSLSKEQVAKVAEEEFLETYDKDLKANKRFYAIAVEEAKDLLNEEEWQNKSVKERFEEAGKRAQKFFKPKESAKITKKKKLKSIKPATKKADLGREEERPSPSDVIKQLAKSRGQKIY